MAKAAPYHVGVDDDGAAKQWSFEPGEVEICAEIIPADEDSQKQVVKECGIAVDESAVPVRKATLPFTACIPAQLYLFSVNRHLLPGILTNGGT